MLFVMLPNYLWVILIRTRTCIVHGKNFNLKWIINTFSCRKVIFRNILCIPKSVISLRMWYILLHSAVIICSLLYTRKMFIISKQKTSVPLCRRKCAVFSVFLGQIPREPLKTVHKDFLLKSPVLRDEVHFSPDFN